jgi:uncharacterized SAM-binding protein YcdF (DUF218 family)
VRRRKARETKGARERRPTKRLADSRTLFPKLPSYMTELDGADAIFVFAGRESRKALGVRLFQQGVAPLLILSVGRFEWRRFPRLGLHGDGGLVELVQATPPPERHFFVRVEAQAARMVCERIPRGRLGTWSEARAVAELVEREGISKLIVVSHPEHLRRCLLSLESFLGDSATVVLVPVPCLEREASRFELGSSRPAELVKYAGYWILAHFRRKHRRA